jgi:hypothetical protein
MRGAANLAGWLRAQFDEDERIARKNTGNDGLGDDGDFPDYRTYDGADIDAACEFLRRFTSQRELREVEAKRRILDEVVPQVNAMDDKIESEWGNGGEGPHDETWLLLRIMALPFAGRPGYLEEWAV